ncbi:MAG: sensor histidine kinase [Clostridia bacterium]|nr:sensor histidine kinase [Clostridia bacterium]
MDKKIMMNFLKDRLGFTFFFFLNTLVIALFYYLSTQSSVEILYPALLSAFLYLIFMAVSFFKFYTFHTRLIKCIDNVNYDLSPSTQEQKEVSNLITTLHQSYLEKIHHIQLENTQKKHFISQWIHNMKTPVSVIDLIVQKSLSGETVAPDTLHDINEENQRLLNNLEQVLSILRLEDFSRDYAPEPIDLVTSLKKMINNRKKQFIYSKVFPKFDPPLESVRVLSDGKWNEVMLDQIISNAIKYSSSGDAPKNIYFSIECQNDTVILTIRDEGIGIPEYDIKRVFEPFFTGENGRRYKNATGIGLYICAMIAEKLGHRISLTSRSGYGTEAKITYLSKL